MERNLLQPRVDLIDQMPTSVRGPGAAIVVSGGGDGILFDLLGLFEDVGVQSPRDVPGDVAVERPDAWVVGFPLYDLMPAVYLVSQSTRKEDCCAVGRKGTNVS